MSVEVTAESTVNPTEDEKKVERALRNIFPSGSIQKTKKQNDTVLLTVRNRPRMLGQPAQPDKAG